MGNICSSRRSTRVAPIEPSPTVVEVGEEESTPIVPTSPEEVHEFVRRIPGLEEALEGIEVDPETAENFKTRDYPLTDIEIEQALRAYQLGYLDQDTFIRLQLEHYGSMFGGHKRDIISDPIFKMTLIDQFTDDEMNAFYEQLSQLPVEERQAILVKRGGLIRDFFPMGLYDTISQFLYCRYNYKLFLYSNGSDLMQYIVQPKVVEMLFRCKCGEMTMKPNCVLGISKPEDFHDSTQRDIYIPSHLDRHFPGRADNYPADKLDFYYHDLFHLFVESCNPHRELLISLIPIFQQALEIEELNYKTVQRIKYMIATCEDREFSSLILPSLRYRNNPMEQMLDRLFTDTTVFSASPEKVPDAFMDVILDVLSRFAEEDPSICDTQVYAEVFTYATIRSFFSCRIESLDGLDLMSDYLEVPLLLQCKQYLIDLDPSCLVFGRRRAVLDQINAALKKKQQKFFDCYR